MNQSVTKSVNESLTKSQSQSIHQSVSQLVYSVLCIYTCELYLCNLSKKQKRKPKTFIDFQIYSFTDFHIFQVQAENALFKAAVEAAAANKFPTAAG